jgi:hypothetical protein
MFIFIPAKMIFSNSKYDLNALLPTYQICLVCLFMFVKMRNNLHNVSNVNV